jgi:hypothetical protein
VKFHDDETWFLTLYMFIIFFMLCYIYYLLSLSSFNISFNIYWIFFFYLKKTKDLASVEILYWRLIFLYFMYNILDNISILIFLRAHDTILQLLSLLLLLVYLIGGSKIQVNNCFSWVMISKWLCFS